jgi:hypothetical protein
MAAYANSTLPCYVARKHSLQKNFRIVLPKVDNSSWGLKLTTASITSYLLVATSAVIAMHIANIHTLQITRLPASRMYCILMMIGSTMTPSA